MAARQRSPLRIIPSVNPPQPQNKSRKVCAFTSFCASAITFRFPGTRAALEDFIRFTHLDHHSDSPILVANAYVEQPLSVAAQPTIGRLRQPTKAFAAFDWRSPSRSVLPSACFLLMLNTSSLRTARRAPGMDIHLWFCADSARNLAWRVRIFCRNMDTGKYTSSGRSRTNGGPLAAQ